MTFTATLDRNSGVAVTAVASTTFVDIPDKKLSCPKLSRKPRRDQSLSCTVKPKTVSPAYL